MANHTHHGGEKDLVGRVAYGQLRYDDNVWRTGHLRQQSQVQPHHQVQSQQQQARGAGTATHEGR